MPRVCLQFVIVIYPDHTHLLFLTVCHTVPIIGFPVHKVEEGQVFPMITLSYVCTVSHRRLRELHSSGTLSCFVGK